MKKRVSSVNLLTPRHVIVIGNTTYITRAIAQPTHQVNQFKDSYHQATPCGGYLQI